MKIAITIWMLFSFCILTNAQHKGYWKEHYQAIRNSTVLIHDLFLIDPSTGVAYKWRSYSITDMKPRYREICMEFDSLLPSYNKLAQEQFKKRYDYKYLFVTTDTALSDSLYPDKIEYRFELFPRIYVPSIDISPKYYSCSKKIDWVVLDRKENKTYVIIFPEDFWLDKRGYRRLIHVLKYPAYWGYDW